MPIAEKVGVALIGVILIILAVITLLKPKVNKVAQKAGKDPKKVTYDFAVNIISGSLTGRQFTGFFSYDPSVLKGKGQEIITVLEAEFNYLSQYTHQDGIPNVSFTDGNFERFIWVLGKPTERFGCNDGFQRWQFGRSEEAFIREGQDYFGYLDRDTYVDGAGRITYKRREL